MKRRVWDLGLGCAVVLALGCSKKEPTAAPVPSSVSSAVAGSSAAPVASVVSAAGSGEPAPAVSAARGVASAAVPDASSHAADAGGSPVAEVPPESFSDGEPVEHANARGLGCELRAKDGWQQLLCRKKNGTGGHPKRAVLGVEGESPDVLPDEQGELRVAFRVQGDARTSGFVEWTDTKYTLSVKDGNLDLQWAVGLPLRRACAKLEAEQKAIILAAQKTEAEDRLTAMEAAKFPRFGVCQPAGFGSYALVLREVLASGVDAARGIKFDLDVAHVALDGTTTRGNFGTVQSRPGGFEVKPLQIYDYDDDGSDELIVPYELKAIPKGVVPASLSAVWSLKSGAIVPYEKLSPTLGGAQTTHLEYDMRADVGRYDPFVVYLDEDCGGASCPARLVGPLRYARSMPDGSFNVSDAKAETAMRSACPKGNALVVPGNLAQTAKNVACAKLGQEDSAKVEAALRAGAPALCKGQDACGLLDALLRFVASPPSE